MNGNLKIVLRYVNVDYRDMKRNRDILSFFQDREVKATNILSSSSPAEGVQGVEETQEGRGGTQASGNQLTSSQTEVKWAPPSSNF